MFLPYLKFSGEMGIRGEPGMIGPIGRQGEIGQPVWTTLQKYKILVYLFDLNTLEWKLDLIFSVDKSGFNLNEFAFASSLKCQRINIH